MSDYSDHYVVDEDRAPAGPLRDRLKRQITAAFADPRVGVVTVPVTLSRAEAATLHDLLGHSDEDLA